ncbi:MAG: DUF4355 domain-containing protein [Ruminococcus sp.]|nr:DUF4355 domain-containing protein [Ruminococcus sp.]
MKEILRIPMQFFAESAETEPTGTAGGQTAPQSTEPKAEEKPAAAPDKTFSQADVDRIVAERLERQQKKFNAEKEEAAKLAKMNAEQKAEYAAKKREEELSERESAVQKKELRFEALNILEENKLPSKLVDCLDLTSAETCSKSIEAIKTAWTEALTAAVDARLKSNAPPAFSGGNKETDPFLSEFGL